MRLLLLEVVFVACVVAGIALVSVPCALILGGLCGVYACERGSAEVGAGRSKTTGADR